MESKLKHTDGSFPQFSTENKYGCFYKMGESFTHTFKSIQKDDKFQNKGSVNIKISSDECTKMFKNIKKIISEEWLNDKQIQLGHPKILNNNCIVSVKIGSADVDSIKNGTDIDVICNSIFIKSKGLD